MMQDIESLRKRIEKLEKEKADKPGCALSISWGTSIWFCIFLAYLLVAEWGWDRNSRISLIPVTYDTLYKAGVIEFADETGLKLKPKILKTP